MLKGIKFSNSNIYILRGNDIYQNDRDQAVRPKRETFKLDAQRISELDGKFEKHTVQKLLWKLVDTDFNHIWLFDKGHAHNS